MARADRKIRAPTIHAAGVLLFLLNWFSGLEDCGGVGRNAQQMMT
jgi:hypothetical protein